MQIQCQNCHTNLPGTADYCSKCGGKVIRKRLTLKNLFEHISETFFNYDNKLLRTCTTLFTDPVDVIDGYVRGVRKRYVNPLSFFGLSLTLSGIALYVLQKFYIDEIDFSMYLYGSNDSEGFRDVMSSIIEYNSIFSWLF